MADTQRTQADLLTNLFQDSQTNGSISAQDLRDLIISLTPSIGSMYISTPAATTIGGAGTFVKSAGTTTFQTGSGHGFTMPADNRLTYGGTVQRDFMIDVSLSSSCSAPNKSLSYRLALNGTTVPATEMKRESGGTGTIGSVSISYYTHLVSGDYLELWLTNDDTTDSVTVQSMFMNIAGWSA